MVMKGDSIEYYYAGSDVGVELFTKANLIKYPINKEKYITLVNNAINTIINCVYVQESEDLF